MKKLRILWGILKRTRADHILLGFILFLLADAAVIRLVEPDIHRYGDALWYCYAVISTAGFGDIVTVTLIGKICSVLLTIYTIFVVAIVTGVVVNFYTQLVEMQQKETLSMFMDKLEHLPELSEPDILRTIAFFRYINPEANIRLAAGRALLTNDGETAFKAGASASITGNMLTTVACATIRSDRQMLADMGRDVTPEYWKEV